jgi:outer membrane receptor protein involved in Fe transport
MFRRSLIILPFILSFLFGGALTGTVKNNANGKSIPNANIYIVETKQGRVTDPYGFFEIDLPNGSYTIQITNIGFKSYSSEIAVAGQPVKLNVELESTILEFGEISVEGLFSTRLGYESVDILSGDQIKSMEKESVSDVLRMLPGVDVQFAHPNGRNANLSIRGSSDYKPGGYNNRVLLLLDGFPIQIPNSGAPDWNSLPLESIQRIEVDNSPASAQYGHNSMGGVINLITDYNGKNQSTKIKLGGGTFTTAQTSLTHYIQKGNWILGVNGMARKSAGHRFNADDQSNRIRSYLKYADQKGRTYRLSHILSYSDNGHPGFASTPSWRRSERTSHYLQGHGFYPIGAGVSMSHSLFLNKFDTRYYDKNGVPDKKTVGERMYNDITVGFRSEMLITRWERWIFMAGSDLDWSRSKVTVFNPIYDSPSQFSLGSFIQSKYSIGNGWSMGSGLR